jgi:cytochrome c2
VLSISLICLSPILLLGSPLWQLGAKELTLVELAAGAYFASAVVGSLYAYFKGASSAIAATIIGLAAFGIIFLLMLVTRIPYARSLLLELFALAMILNLAPFAVRFIPRIAVAGMASIAVAMLVLSISNKGDLLRFQPSESESRKVLTTALYNVVAKEHHGRIPRSGTKGGGLARMGEQILLATGDGTLFMLRFSGEAQELTVRELPFAVPLNASEFISQTDESVDERRFRVGDILVQDRGDTFRIFASHHYWNQSDKCFAVRLSSTIVDQDAKPVGNPTASWTTVFESSPCLGVREAKSGDQPQYPKFAGHQMGGRLALLEEQSLLVTVGDHRFDGLNAAQLLPQDATSSYGKTILIDLTTDSSEVFSLGHRNPQGLFVDNSGTIWMTEHGPQGGDELNRLSRNVNYGWPLTTFGTDYGSFSWPLNQTQGSHDNYQSPIYSWTPGLGISDLIAVERNLFPLWQDDLLISTLATGMIIRARIHDGRLVNSESIKIGQRIRGLVETTEGVIVLWTDSSAIITMNPAETVALAPSERGKLLFASCAGCHQVNDGKTHGIGPDLAGVIGRRVAAADGYRYSESMSKLSGNWTETELDAFLADPQTYAPGTLMIGQGISDPSARSAIIDYLKSQ